MIPIYKPYFTRHSLRFAHDAIDSTWVSSAGKYIDIVTEDLREKLKIKNILLVNNGTSATHLVAKSLKFKNSKIKKLIVPNNVYVAAWNCFLYEGYELQPIDADLKTWNFDVSLLPKKLPEDTGILVVHNIGNIIDVPNLVEKYGRNSIVEDNCEGFLGTHRGSFSGTKSLASSVSFFGNKNITSGEGGAVIVDNEETYDFIKSANSQGMILEKRYIHDKMGYNYRMTNVQAAILLGQLEILNEIVERKQIIFENYRKRFLEMDGIRIQEIDPKTKHSNWMMAIRIINSPNYEKVEKFLKKRGVDSRPMFYPMSFHDHLTPVSRPKNEKVAKKLSKQCLMLPSYPELTSDEQNHIIKCVAEATKK